MAVAAFAQGVTDSNYWASHLNTMKPQTQIAAAASTGTSSANSGKPLLTTGADGKSFFQNVLDVVNPLEHLPVVSTIYHAITGNQSGDVEKIAGDTLYGGPIGLVSSIADVAFEKITGKDFGDTMLAMVGIGGDDDKNTALAANTSKADDAEAVRTAALNKASLATTIQTPTPMTKLAQAADMSSLVKTVTPVAAPEPVQTAAAASANATAQAAQSIVDISPQTDALLAALQKNGVTGAMQTQALDAYRRTVSMNSPSANSATVH
jgi:hypothetical protein